MKAKIAFIFPGQGSQYVGMGKQLYDASPAARRIFDQADTALGFSLSNLCFDGPQEELDDTYNAQPAILTYCIASLEAMKELRAELKDVKEPERTKRVRLQVVQALINHNDFVTVR